LKSPNTYSRQGEKISGKYKTSSPMIQEGGQRKGKTRDAIWPSFCNGEKRGKRMVFAKRDNTMFSVIASLELAKRKWKTRDEKERRKDLSLAWKQERRERKTQQRGQMVLNLSGSVFDGWN